MKNKTNQPHANGFKSFFFLMLQMRKNKPDKKRRMDIVILKDQSKSLIRKLIILLKNDCNIYITFFTELIIQ